MKADIAEILRLLKCPRCGGTVAPAGDGVACAAPRCLGTFETVSGVPVLVDFDDSILDREQVRRTGGASEIARAGTGLRSRLGRWVSGGNSVAAAQERVFVGHIKRASPRPTVLVVGGATVGKGMRLLYDDQDLALVSFDVYASPAVTFIADAHRIPLADGSVDGVWIQAVLEHVLDPRQVVSEIHRVLRAGGVVYAETPFMQQVHEGPYDFTRFTPSGHRWLFRAFEELDAGAVAGAATQLLWSLEYFVRALTRSRAAGKAVKVFLAPLRFLDRACGRAHSEDSASAVFFLGIKGPREMRMRDMPRYYRGAVR